MSEGEHDARSRSGPMLTDSRAGFVLLAALLVLVFAAGLLTDAALRARVERRQASNAQVDIRARAAARAGLAHGIARLTGLQRRSISAQGADPALTDAWNRVEVLAQDLRSVPLRQSGRYEVSMQDAASKLPVNDASEEELRRLFLSLGAEYRNADVAAQSILDWRDEDDLHRARGAEWDDYYRRQPDGTVPRNGPFATMEELRQVRGMESLPPAALEHLTVFGSGRVNLNTAREPVLRALPGLTDEAVTLTLTRRRVGRPLRNLSELEANLSTPARAVLQREFAALVLRASFEPQALEITASGWVESNPLRRTVHALAVRAGPTIQVVWSVER